MASSASSIVPAVGWSLRCTNWKLTEYPDGEPVAAKCTTAEAAGDEIERLLAQMNNLNGLRSMLPLIGGTLGVIEMLA